MTPPIRVVELFSGIGAQASALERAGIPHECVAVCEIDKYAYASYCAIHGNVPNLGDITKVKRLPECDLLTYSFPCTDLSMAGKRKGMTRGSGTRSGLLWEVERLLMDMRNRDHLPMTLVMENVDAITYKANKKDFKQWISALSDMGYASSYKVLNASDYGIPQNRDRCFMVSRLDSLSFQFPRPRPSDIRLKDILEWDVPKRYFLSNVAVAGLIAHKKHDTRNNGFGHKITDPEKDNAATLKASCGWKNTDTFLECREGSNTNGLDLIGNLTVPGRSETSQRVYDPKGISPTICTMQGGGLQPKIAVYPCLSPDRIEKRQNGPRFRGQDEDMFTLTAQDRHGILIRNNTSQGYIEAQDGDGLILDQPDSKTKRGRVQEGRSPTVMTSGQVGTVDKMRIRRLTPRECWRLMGFTDDDFDRVKKIRTSDAQLYKQAGNSIVVDVLVAIFDELYNTKQRIKQPTLMEFEKAII